MLQHFKIVRSWTALRWDSFFGITNPIDVTIPMIWNECIRITQILLKFTQIYLNSLAGRKGQCSAAKIMRSRTTHITCYFFMYLAPNLDDNSSDSQNLLKIYSNLPKIRHRRLKKMLKFWSMIPGPAFLQFSERSDTIGASDAVLDVLRDFCAGSSGWNDLAL